MKAYSILTTLILINCSIIFGQQNFSSLEAIANDNISENEMILKIQQVDKSATFKELASLIDICKINFNNSENITKTLSEWLKENNSIYKDKSFNEVEQFRAYLIYSFSFFVKEKNVAKYLTYELNYSGHQNIIAAAIHTARFYNEKELNLLIEPYTDDNYNVNVNFNKFEIGSIYNSTIQQEANSTIKYINELNDVTKKNPINSCCSIVSYENDRYKLDLIKRKSRKSISPNLNFLDQENSKCNFNEFKGSPFLITFFYTSCTNQNKCAASISKLKALQDKLDKNKIGIYALTYDSYIDKPEVLKKYGEIYNFNFSSSSKFLVAASEDDALSTNKVFNTLVNYGNGVVNQHGTQLFIFDKNGKIAFQFENELWRTEDLITIFNKLCSE